MAWHTVGIPIKGYMIIEVEADSAKEAVRKAYDEQYELSDDFDYEIDTDAPTYCDGEEVKL